MDQLNALIELNPRRLGAQLVSMTARTGHSMRIALKGVPGDVTGVFLRIFKPNGAYFDFPCNEHPNGAWTVYVIGTAFPDQGDATYEVHATDALGHPTALGMGALSVLPFSVTSTPITPGSTVTVAQVPTSDGSFVQIQMVQDEVGQWVYRAVQ